MKKLFLSSLVLTSLVLSGCTGEKKNTSSLPDSIYSEEQTTEFLTLSKEDYYNKTLGGLLGQFAGFLSGYEFLKDGPDPAVGLPSEWFEFINGPYAGNDKHFVITHPERYDRLRYIAGKGVNVVFSDDDYHIDIFNQMIIDEAGYTAEDIKNSWIRHKVHDWGGGYEANRICNVKDYVSPFVGTLEAGNAYSWCTEAYIENETIGMDAAAMPNTANILGERFASLTGYFEPVIWAKLYATMYSYAYIYDDINVILEKSRPVVPKGSWVDRLIDVAVEMYNKYPNDYVKAAKEIYQGYYRTTKGIDNIQTNPGINGAFTIYSMLYGQGDYMKAALASSMMGFDGDCTAATVCGLYGILKGFKPGNPEYNDINEKLYQNGNGLYYNDTVSGFDPYIGAEYPDYQKITDIIDLYQKNYEKILVDNGGSIVGENYKVPVQKLQVGTSMLFENYDLEAETLSGFASTKNAYVSVYEDGENEYSHSGYRAMRVGYQEGKTGKVEAYHTFKNLEVGKYYRLSTFVRSDTHYYSLFARDRNGDTQEFNFFNKDYIVNNVLIFRATNKTMDVGVAFEGESDGDFLVLDDFMLEEINNNFVGYLIKNQLPKKYLSKLAFRASGVKLNQQMTLRVKYRCLSDFDVSILRNGEQAFAVPFYGCSLDNNEGCNVVEIPYEFKTADETVSLSFTGNSIYIESIELLYQETYSFR